MVNENLLEIFLGRRLSTFSENTIPSFAWNARARAMILSIISKLKSKGIPFSLKINIPNKRKDTDRDLVCLSAPAQIRHSRAGGDMRNASSVISGPDCAGMTNLPA